jgi:hypothetical protein
MITEISDLILANAQFILTMAIAVMTVHIGWEQWQTNRNQFRLNFFDRRFAVYKAAMALDTAILVKGDTITGEEVHEFEVATQGARFLFNEKIQGYCDKLRNEAFELVSGKMRTAALPQGDQRTQSINRESERLKWFSVQYEVIPEQFAPFLKVTG